MPTEIILDNARIVFEDVVVHGHMVLRSGHIAVADRGCIGLSYAYDMDGDLLVALPRHHENVENLLRTAWWLHARIGLNLPEAFGTLLRGPGPQQHDERAAINVGRRADLIRVREHATAFVLRACWRSGQPINADLRAKQPA